MPGAARIITYPAFGANVQYGEGQIQIQFNDAAGTAHVFPLPPESAKQIRDGLTEALSGIKIVESMPNGDRAEKLL